MAIDRELCVGAGMCVLTAPRVFDQDETDGRVLLITDVTNETVMASIEEAVSVCPSGALSIVDTDE